MATRPPPHQATAHTAQLSIGPGAAAGGASSGAGPAPSMSCFSWGWTSPCQESPKRKMPGDTRRYCAYHGLSCYIMLKPAPCWYDLYCLLHLQVNLGLRRPHAANSQGTRLSSQVSISESQQPVCSVSGRNRTCQSWWTHVTSPTARKV